jgi:hypothetical protein
LTPNPQPGPQRRPLSAEPESLIDLTFPVRGLDVSHAHVRQPPETTSVGTNVRGFEPGTNRARGGARPALVRYLPDALPPGGPVQHLNYIVDPSGKAQFRPIDWEPGDFPFDFWWFDGGDPLLGSDPISWVEHFPPEMWYPPSDRLEAVRIVWEDPADVPLHTVLSATQLNAQAVSFRNGSPVGGTFAYSPPAGHTFDTLEEHYPLNAIFTPADATRYRGASRTVHIKVVPAGIAFVQASNSPTSTDPYSGDVVFDSPVGAGNLIVVGVFNQVDPSAPYRVSSITDSLGNTYTQAGSYADGDGALIQAGVSLSVWYAISVAGGACTVTVTSGTPKVCAAEYSGVRATAPLRSTAKVSAVTELVPFVAGPLSVPDAGGLGVAIWAFPDDPSTSDPAAWTRRAMGTPLDVVDLALFDVIPEGAGSVSLTITSAFDVAFWAMASFRPG